MRFSNHQWVIKICLVCVLAISMSSQLAMAADYFVATNGNDGNRGTIQQPFRSLERGFNVLIPGDTLFVRGGSYRGPGVHPNISNGNSWNQPVTIKAYKQESVVFVAAPGKTALHFKPKSHFIIIDGIIFDAKGGWHGIFTGAGSHHIRIMNGEVKNAPKQGILTVNGSEYFEFLNLRVHHNGGTSDFNHGFYISTSNHLVKNCEIYNNAGGGLHLYSQYDYKPHYNLVIGNKIHDNAAAGNRGVGIGIYGGTQNTVINNLVWGNKMGIGVDYGASNSKIYNNTIVNHPYGIYLGANGHNSKVMNNIITSSWAYGLLIAKASQNSQIKNNLIYGSGAGSREVGNQSASTTLSNNLLGLNYNAQFENLGAFDFRLKSGSPAIDRGLKISEIGYDFNYISRPKGSSHDIGAHERPQ